jgi:alpha-L-fucosidase
VTERSRTRLGAAASVFLLLFFCVVPLPAQVSDPAHEKRLEWWREARFGMFIHWGLYAVPAGEWKGKLIPGIGEWIMNRARIPVSEYELLARQFNPVKFNADEWVRLAKEAGQKYIVITSKHHDGFAMYRSKVSPYNIADATPFQRDPMAELAEACRRHGLRLCFYYSQAQDWHHPNGVGNSWDYDESKKDFAEYFNNLAKPQVREILTQYGPIGLIWFDTPMRITKEQSQDIANLVHALQPACLVSGRVGHDVGDYRSMGDNQIPAKVLDYDWETPVTLNDTWGFKKDDHNWKSTQTLIRQLVDVVSKNGNYLLNVGPTAEGLIPQPSVERLLEVGRWMKVNNQAIYGAAPSPFPYEFDWGAITVKPGKLYLHLVEWPVNEFVLYGLKNKVKAARLLAQPATALKFKQTADLKAGLDVLRVSLPKTPPDKDVSVVALEIDGAPQVDAQLKQQPDGRVVLSPIFAEVRKASAESSLAIDNRGVATRWFNPQDTLSWSFRCYRPGSYKVVLVTSESRGPQVGDLWEGGHTVRVAVAGQEIKGLLTEGEWRKNARNPRWRDLYTELGTVTLKGPALAQLSVQPESIRSEKRMGFTLREVQLVPVKR